MKRILALLTITCACCFAQNPASFAGWFSAYNYAYGVNRGPSSLRVDRGNSVTGSQSTITLAFGVTTLSDGRYFTPLATNAPITIGNGANTETVTPSAVNCTTPQLLDTCTVTATFTQLHNPGDQIRSGTVGLQEALNAANAAGGGAGVVDSTWYANGGTSGILAAAVTTGVTATCDNSKGAGCGSGGGGGGTVTGATLNGVTVPLVSTVLQFQLPNIANTGLGVNNVLSGTGNAQVNTLEVNLNPDYSLTTGATIPATDCGAVLGSATTQTWNLPQAGLGGNFKEGCPITFVNTGGVLTLTPSTSSIGGGAGGANYTIPAGTTTLPTVVTIVSHGGNYPIVNQISPQRAIGVVFDGAGSALSSGKTIYFTVPFACTINSWNLTADTGTATIKFWKVATGTAIPTSANSINTSGVSLASGTAIHSTTLSDFTSTAVTANDIFGVNLFAVASATTVSAVLGCR
jgi:hypothetical protein